MYSQHQYRKKRSVPNESQTPVVPYGELIEKDCLKLSTDGMPMTTNEKAISQVNKKKRTPKKKKKSNTNNNNASPKVTNNTQKKSGNITESGSSNASNKQKRTPKKATNKRKAALLSPVHFRTASSSASNVNTVSKVLIFDNSASSTLQGTVHNTQALPNNNANGGARSVHSASTPVDIGKHERWAGGAFQNAPRPSALPMPVFEDSPARPEDYSVSQTSPPQASSPSIPIPMPHQSMTQPMPSSYRHHSYGSMPYPGRSHATPLHSQSVPHYSSAPLPPSNPSRPGLISRPSAAVALAQQPIRLAIPGSPPSASPAPVHVAPPSQYPPAAATQPRPVASQPLPVSQPRPLAVPNADTSQMSSQLRKMLNISAVSAC